MKQDVVYDVAAADTVQKLTREVNAALKRGWELVGGVSSSPVIDDLGRYQYLFSQALIRERNYRD